MWRNRRLAPSPGPGENDEPADNQPADGAFQSLDHMAHWVRFADTKATILTAGLGVVLTVLMTNAPTIAESMRQSCPAAAITGGLASGALLAFAWTLFWLVRAIAPQSAIQYQLPNRFAWPSLLRTTPDDLAQHARDVDVRTDAWQQVIDLAAIANRKFAACGKAVWGFALVVALGVACVSVAIGFTS